MRKSINLMLKNSFKNAFGSWSQFIGLVLLITFLSVVISLMSSISIRVVDNYDNLAKASNLRTLVVDLPSSTFVGKDKDADGAPDNIVESQQYYIYKLNKKYEKENPELTFDWSRTEGRNFSGLKNGNYDLKVKTVAKTTPNYSASHQKVDALAISEGHGIQSTKQVVLDATFAKRNDVKIGDIIRVQEDTLGNQLKVQDAANNYDKDIAKKINQIKNLDDKNDIFTKEFLTYKWLQVVGYGESADYVMPIIDEQSTLPNKDTELVAYVDPTIFGLIKDEASPEGLYFFDQARSTLSVASSSDSEAYYSLKMRDGRKTISNAEVDKMNEDFLKIIGKDKQGKENKIIYSNEDLSYKYSGRTMSIISTLKIYNLIATGIVILILIVTIFTVVLVTKKQIDKTRSQIGVMKALGYRKRQIVFNFIALPFITSLMGGIFGFVIAQFVQIPIIGLFGTYFNLDFSAWTFDYVGFIVVVVLMWFIISAVSFFIAYQIMKKDTLSLINANRSSKIGRLGMFIKSLNPKHTTESKMKAALLASSTGKMTGVGIVVLFATIIMTMTFAAPNIWKDNQERSYTGIKYNQLVEYASPVYNDPYTFMKTYDANTESEKFNYSKALQKVTGLSLEKQVDKNGNVTYGGYDMDKILEQLYTGNIQSGYYGLEFGAKGATGNPSSLEIMLANMKMLNPYGTVLSDDYFKTISDWANYDAFGWTILANQWPDYLNLVGRIQQHEASLPSNPTQEQLVKFYKQQMLELQSFYRVYSESVGLTVTRDFYDYNKTDEANKAYTEHNYEKQIQLFNDNSVGKQKAFNSFKTERKNGGPAFGEILGSLSYDKTFELSNGTNNGKLPINRIISDKQNKDSQVDIFLSANPDEVYSQYGIDGLKQYLADYLSWYGAYFSNRSGTAIVQAAFTRPPYFVQQYFKDAYYNSETNYDFNFGVVPYDTTKEQLGVKLAVETTDKQGKKPLSFNIYGIENNHKYLDLEDTKGHDLIQKLYSTDDDYEIVINESLSRKLNLKDGDEIDLNVINQELQNQGKAYEVSDWKQDGIRKNAHGEKGFISSSSMDTLGVSVKTPGTDKYVKMSKGSANINNEPGDLYKQYLDGKIATKEIKYDKKFKVAGIHKGYGTPQAWIKNESAKHIMKYDDAENYLWNEMFTKQFGNEFTKDKYKNKGYYLPYNLDGLSYQTFIDWYVNDETNEYHDAAVKINTIFKNTYPIFNFKFSLNDDIGDIKAGVSTYVNLGYYSPISMNGGVAGGVTYDGIGVGAIGTIVPIQISKDILEQMGNVINGILIMLIALTVIVTFVIVLLTTSLIIKDNIRFIGTMKILGYTNKNIVDTVLGMYVVVIVVMFAIGFVAGWFILTGIIGAMVTSTAFVLPIIFPWWLIFSVIAGVVGIYAITFAVGYYYIARANATHVLQNSEI